MSVTVDLIGSFMGLMIRRDELAKELAEVDDALKKVYPNAQKAVTRWIKETK